MQSRGLAVLAGAIVLGFGVANAAERVFTLKEYSNARDWGPELVMYHVTSPGKEFHEGKLALVDASGKKTAFQLSGVAKADGYITQADVSFVARLPKGGTYRYVLHPSEADDSGAGSAVTLKKDGQFIEIGNAFGAIRLPAPREETPKGPVAAASVPAPIAGWKRADGEWVGSSSFFTDRKIASYSIEVAADGPVYKQVDCRYVFEPHGEYLCSVRVVNEVAMVFFTEEYNFGRITEGRDFLVVASGPKVAPAELQFMVPGEDSLGVRKTGPLAQYLNDKRTKAAALPPVGAFRPPAMVPVAAGDLFLEHVLPGATFGFQSGVEVIGGPNRFSLMPLFTGSWRRTNSIQFWWSDQDKLKFLLPISVRLSHWYMDITDDESPFSTHEHDPGLPASYGRRAWGLNLGDEPLDQARMRYGYIGLDRLKEWVLDWKDPKPFVFPRVWLTPPQVEEAKKLLPSNPLAKIDSKGYGLKSLAEMYPFSNSRDAALDAIRLIPAYATRWASFYTHYRHLWTTQWTEPVDLAFSCPDLPADALADARSKIAFTAHDYAEPDFNLRTYGGHQGNNNMPINRLSGTAAIFGLIPGHPKAAEWSRILYEYVRWKQGTQIDASGVNIECILYYLSAPAHGLQWGTVIARNLGFDVKDMVAAQKATIEYLMNLTVPPDPRYAVRIIPGMGNGGPLIDPIFGEYAALFQDADPEFAAKLKWMHEQCMGKTQAHVRPDWTARWPAIGTQAPKLQTAFFPGYGVMFRAHFGDPQETVLLFRQGYVKGHWYTDDGNILLYAKGKPLVPGQSYQYGAWAEPTKDYISYSRVKLGTKGSAGPDDVPDIFGRVEKNIQDYGFLPGADYAVGLTDYPAGIFKQEPKGKSVWNRHIVFIKSATAGGADYFVMRDAFTGAPRPSWWHLMPLSKKEQVQIGPKTIDAATDYGMQMRLWFAGEKPLAATTYPYEAPMAAYGADAEMARTWAELVPNHLDKEVRTIVQLARPAGEDYFYVVYPHKDGEKVADFAELGKAGIKITTRESTDYVFISDEPLKYDADGVLFEGKAGAVRVYPDKVSLIMNSGSGRVGYKGYVVSGHGPFQQDIATKDLTTQEIAIPGGYEKKIVVKMVKDPAGGPDITVRGEEPFSASVADGAITIQCDGRKRIFEVFKPKWLLRPQMFIDGVQAMCAWTDEAGSDWGRLEDSRLMAAGVPDGKHTVVICETQFPPQFDRSFTVRLKNTAAKP